MILICIILFLFIFFLLKILHNKINNETHNENKIGVIVLGNLEQSPRMLYHIDSLINNNFSVCVFAYVKGNKIFDVF